jgi:IS5 family transposase
MKAHIGVDADSGLVHSVRCTSANVHDITVAHVLLHGEEQIAFADAGYQGIEKRGETVRHPKQKTGCSDLPLLSLR